MSVLVQTVVFARVVDVVSIAEGSNDGMIKWKFSSEGTEFVIDVIRITYSSVIFHNGYVRWIMCNEETCIPLKAGENERNYDRDVEMISIDSTSGRIFKSY